MSMALPRLNSRIGRNASRLGLPVLGLPVLGLLMVFAGLPDVQASWQLPAESSLPKAYRPTQQLPSEAMLPREMTRPSERPELPSESLLPASYGEARPADREPEVVDPAQAKPLELPPPEDRVWLRLNLHGHTATVRALRFSHDGETLFSAGEDKVLRVWRYREGNPGDWFHQRQVRWQVQRGPGGRIYALAGNQNLLVMAGHGAMGGQGEIVLVDPMRGTLDRALVDLEKGHRQVVGGLATNGESDRTLVASMDRAGQVNVWARNPDTGIWKLYPVQGPDAERFAPDVAAFLEPRRRFMSLAFLSRSELLLPRYAGQGQKDGRLYARWVLAKLDLSTGQTTQSTDTLSESVTALAISPDGALAVTADALGALVVWDLKQLRQLATVPLDAVPLSLDFHADGQRVVVGTARSPRLDNRASVEVWSVENPRAPRRLNTKRVSLDVNACRFRPGAQELAYTQASEIVFESIDLPQPTHRLAPGALPVSAVAFVQESDSYQLALARSRDAEGKPQWSRTFDLKEFRLQTGQEIDPDLLVSGDRGRGDWRVMIEGEPGQEETWLYQGNQRQARVPLDPAEGLPQSIAWIPTAEGTPFAVAIGTDGRDGIYVYRLEKAEQARLIREFRGHEAAVTALGVSPDLRFLVSAAQDSTVRIWNLQQLHDASTDHNRWGAEFEFRQGRLEVVEAVPDGPIHYQGMRVGDTIDELEWFDDQLRSQDDTSAMLDVLRTVDHRTIVQFHYQRRGIQTPAFQSYPAWRPMLSLFITENREWAAWTPAGYYDASFNGHRLFGWQINRGVDQDPDFFLASQLRDSLERPDILRHLLSAGNLEAAFRVARQMPPGEVNSLVYNETQLAPRLELELPSGVIDVNGDQLRVTARVQVRKGLRHIEPKAFVNGVVAKPELRMTEPTETGFQAFVYEWSTRLPSEPEILLQVVTSTDAEAVAEDSRILRRTDIPKRQRARMMILGAGVNEYQDSQIQKLDYAVNNVESIVQRLTRASAQLYDVDALLLTDQQVTRAMWREVATSYGLWLQSTFQPDDLLVLVFSGHGLSDPRTGNYYFVTPDSRYADLMGGRYDDCLAFDDLARFADVPCRKLVILDTCHSGAIAPQRLQRDLKSALRILQEDLMLTVTASEGSQEAIEDRQRQLGRFTYRFCEGLEGRADLPEQGGDGDGIVTLNEVVRYVRGTVPFDVRGEEAAQMPTFAPSDLLPFIRIPLTSTRQPVTVGQLNGTPDVADPRTAE